MVRLRLCLSCLDQAALTQIFDMAAARRADSFDKCYREITGLLNRLRVKAAF